MKSLSVIVLVAVCTACGQTSTELSIEDAVRLGLENNRLLRISAAKMESAEAGARETATYLLPSVKVNAGYARLSDVDPFRVHLPILPEPITISPTVLNTTTFRASLQQPVFTGFRLGSNARAAENLAEASRHDHENDRAVLALSVSTAYWTLYQTLEMQRLVHENVMRLESYVRDAERLVAAGLATKNDVLKFQVQLSSAKLSQIDAANDAQVAMMSLNNIIGLPLDRPITLVSVPDGSAVTEQALARLAETAGERRGDVLASRYRLDAAKAAVTAAQAGWWPQISLAGNYYYSRPNQRYLPTRDEFLGTWDIGVQLQWDVWNWGATSSRSDQARASLQQAELAVLQKDDDVSLEVTQAHLAVRRAREKVTVARMGLEQAQENARSIGEKYRSGLATSSELLDADVSLLQAQTQYTAALVETEVALARLRKAVGVEVLENKR